MHFKAKDRLISRPVIFLDRGFGMTPMNQGLRAVGTVELGVKKILHLRKGLSMWLIAQKNFYLNLENMKMNG